MKKQQERRSGRKWRVALVAAGLGTGRVQRECSQQPRTRMGGGDLRNAARVQDLRGNRW